MTHFLQFTISIFRIQYLIDLPWWSPWWLLCCVAGAIGSVAVLLWADRIFNDEAGRHGLKLDPRDWETMGRKGEDE